MNDEKQIAINKLLLKGGDEKNILTKSDDCIQYPLMTRLFNSKKEE